MAERYRQFFVTQGLALEGERGSHPGVRTAIRFPGVGRPFDALRDGRATSCETDPGQLDLFRAMAGDEMPRAEFAEVGRLRAADLCRIGAARVKVAA